MAPPEAPGDGHSAGEALARLDAITHRLRCDCPWDREQDERSIVPHTVEEAYELADAAHGGDDAKLLDELGDVLFQVCFLAMLLQERGAGDLGAVAGHVTEKLIRRHPHVFGEAEAETAGQVLANWDQIKQTEAGREPGIFGEVPENLPSLLYARKVQRRAKSSGFDHASAQEPLSALHDMVQQLDEAVVDGAREERFAAVGGLLFAAVNVARKLDVDPELALRDSSDAFRGRVTAAGELAAADGRSWDDLAFDEQIVYYARVAL